WAFAAAAGLETESSSTTMYVCRMAADGMLAVTPASRARPSIARPQPTTRVLSEVLRRTKAPLVRGGSADSAWSHQLPVKSVALVPVPEALVPLSFPVVAPEGTFA